MPTPTVNFPFVRELRRAQARRLVRQSDGDTPVIEQPVRMVSCDTPEKAAYAGRPDIAQLKLDRCRQRLSSIFYSALPSELRDYLLARLTTDAAERHIGAASGASAAFDRTIEERLTLRDGKKRNLAIIPTGEMVDTFGRLLAYFAPFFDKGELPQDPNDPRRKTFNLEMVENGWAAFFPLYPSLPKNSDLNRAIVAAEVAWEEKRGAWEAFGADLLLGYEYRMCIKLGAEDLTTGGEGITKAFERSCIDLRDLSDRGPFGFWDVPPPYRLWYWLSEREEARHGLGLA